MAMVPEMTKTINNMEKRMYNVSAMLSILKDITTSGIDATSCGFKEVCNFIEPRKQFENWFIAEDELNDYKVYRGNNVLAEDSKTHFDDALSGYYFYSYDEPINDLCPTYTIEIDRLSGNVVIYVYYLG